MFSREQFAPALASLALCAIAPVSRADAQDSPAEATRRVLIHDAEAASERGDHAQAVSLAARAAQVRATPSLRMFLSAEYAAIHDWLHAYVTATECLGDVRADPSVPHRRTILASCERAERDASPHVAWLILRVPADAQGLEVRIAGDVVQAALYGARYPVAAGAVAVTAHDASGGRFEAEVRVAEGQSNEVVVALARPALPPPPDSPPAPAPEVSAAEPVLGPRLPSPAPAPGGGVTRGPSVLAPPPAPDRRWVGPLMVGVGGVVALGVAGVFAALRASARDARDEADANFEADSAWSYQHQFETYTDVTNASIGVGAACVAAGALWFGLSRGVTATRHGMTVAPAMAWSRRGASLSLQGAW